MSSYETIFTLPVPVASVVPAGVGAAAAVGKGVHDRRPTSLVCRGSWRHLQGSRVTLKLMVSGTDGAAVVHLIGSNVGFGPINDNTCKQEVEEFWAGLVAILQRQWGPVTAQAAASTPPATPTPTAPRTYPAYPPQPLAPQYGAPSASLCSVCGTARNPGAAFCSGCGTSFTRQCPSCGGALGADARFCEACGYNLSAGAVPPPTAGAAAGMPPLPMPPLPMPPIDTARRRGRGRRLVKYPVALLVVVLPAALVIGVLGPLVANAAATVQVDGYASLARPLTGANVSVYEMGRDGQPGALLATGVTDKNGYMTASASRHPKDTLLLTTSGGSYVDEISHESVSAGPNDSLKTVLVPGANYAALTPLTTFATARAQSLAASGNSLSDSIAVSYAAVARQFNLETITDVAPATADNPQDVQVSGRTARQMGMILAGLDEEASSLSVSDFGFTNALAQDLSDGTFDGKEGATQITIGDPGPLPPDAATMKLQEAISRFTASPINASHLPMPQVSQQAASIDLSPGVLFVSSPGLPAFIDGEPASASIGSGGGKTPITCALASGQMPAGFSLSPDCTIQYDGTLVLGTSVERITAPFTVDMSDSSQPVQSVSFDLRITIIARPPVIAVADGKCPQVRKPCSITIATATGGTRPYYFIGEFGYGSKPLGMFIQLNGVLSGSPATAGSYTFDVCVVDLVGAENCAATTVVVAGAPSPSSVTADSGQPTSSCFYSIAYPAYLGASAGTLVMGIDAPGDLCASIFAQDGAGLSAAGFTVTRPDAAPPSAPVCNYQDANGYEVTIWGTGTAGLPAANAICGP